MYLSVILSKKAPAPQDRMAKIRNVIVDESIKAA